MSMNRNPIEITGFRWVPPFAHGLVRDLRVRWTLEELGLSYSTQLFDPREERAAMMTDQPFGQVPACSDGDARLFESGAICLWLAERSEALLPRDSGRRARVLSWAIAALNSVEPFLLAYQMVSFFDSEQPGAADYLPVVEERARKRLRELSDALGNREWIAGDFSVADILMVHVLTPPGFQRLCEGLPDLVAYVERGHARPAYRRALEAQIEDFAAKEEA